MNAAIAALAILATSGLAGVEGRVLDDGGRPIANARVFMEQGLGGPVEEVRSGADGVYRFNEVLPKQTGFFAIASGYSFGGRFQVISLDEQVSGFDITLYKAANVTGVVKSASGEPVEGATIGRVALEDLKTSVPFFKLQSRGIALPRSDAQGRFTIPNLPAGQQVALKIGHPSYAQAALRGVRAGERNLQIRLDPGAMVSGSVVSRGDNRAVPDAPILFSEVQPKGGPNPATFVTVSGFDGTYSIRLLPGRYVVRAEGAQFQSQNMQVIEVAESQGIQQYVVNVSGKGRVFGRVMDARTEAPVAGARLLLESLGNPVGITATGPGGEYEFDAAAGEVTVKLLSAPGYLKSSDSGFKLLLQSGSKKEIPVIWLAPIPDYSIFVTDPDERPVAGALVTILEPRQFGWRTTGSDGKVSLEFGQLPESGRVIGWVEHPRAPLGAIFAIDRTQPENNTVELLPLTETRGTVKNDRGAPLEGVYVEGVLLDETNRELTTLWTAITDSNGEYHWPASVPYAPQGVIAYGKAKDGAPVPGRSAPFVIEKTGGYAADDIVLTGAVDGDSALNTKLRWNRFIRLTPEPAEPHGGAYLVLLGVAANAPALYETAENAARILQNRDIDVRVVLNEQPASAPPNTLHVFVGETGKRATSWLVDADGRIVLETVGMPPLAQLNRVAPPLE